MESQLAGKLAEMLRDVEKREETLVSNEKAVKVRNAGVEDREEAVTAREGVVSAESIKLDGLRSVSEERAKTHAMQAQLKRDQEALSDQRSTFAKESQSGNSVLHKERVELGAWKTRLIAQEQEIVKGLEALKQEKIKHHEKVVEEFKEIEDKRKELENGK